MELELNDDRIEEEIEAQYELQTVEQLQAISDPIRYRMILLLRTKAMTGAQLARAMNLSRPRAHYYLKTLVDSGLVRFLGERIDNGMIGKYYRAIANYFSYDQLAARSRENPTSPESLQIFKSITDFAMTVLETSRDNIHVSEDMALGYHFTFETGLTTEQHKMIVGEIRALVEHLIAIKKLNHAQKARNANLHFRTTIFFTPSPRNPIQDD